MLHTAHSQQPAPDDIAGELVEVTDCFTQLPGVLDYQVTTAGYFTANIHPPSTLLTQTWET